MKRALPWAGLALAFAYLAAMMARRFSEFPGLHGDEAWAGLYSLRILKEGVRSIHEMNTYTGPLYGWIVSRSFAALGVEVWSLRLPGLLANAAAAALMAVHLARRIGFPSAFAWLYLLASSALFVLKSRVAWEVYALQNLLLAAAVIPLTSALARGRPSPAAAAAFLAAVYAGTFNHFIFLSVPLSLAICLAARAAMGREEGGLLGLSVWALALCGALCALKPLVSDAFWLRHRVWLGPAALAAPLAAFALWRRWSLDGALSRALRGPLFAGSPRAWRAAGTAALAAFFLIHWVALMQIWSGVSVLQRLASWDPPTALKVALYAWASVPLGLFFARALAAVDPARADRMGSHERLLTLWALAYAAVFPLFRNITSIRYYVPISFLIAASLACALPGALAAARRPAWAALHAAVAGLLNVLFWREPARVEERPPILFRIGTHKERSFSFLSKEPLFAELARERACRFKEKDSFIDLPLMFLYNARGFSCDARKSAAARLCEECRTPPYFALRIEHEPG